MNVESATAWVWVLEKPTRRERPSKMAACPQVSTSIQQFPMDHRESLESWSHLLVTITMRMLTAGRSRVRRTYVSFMRARNYLAKNKEKDELRSESNNCNKWLLLRCSVDCSRRCFVKELLFCFHGDVSSKNYCLFYASNFRFNNQVNDFR